MSESEFPRPILREDDGGDLDDTCFEVLFTEIGTAALLIDKNWVPALEELRSPDFDADDENSDAAASYSEVAVVVAALIANGVLFIPCSYEEWMERRPAVHTTPAR